MLNRGVINKVVELLHKKKRAKLLSKRNKNRKSSNGKKPRSSPDNKNTIEVKRSE